MCQVGSIGLLVSLAYTSDAENPLQGPQSDLSSGDLFNYFQQRKEITRLSAVITGGFCAPDDTNPWTQFLVRGLYDPRVLLVVADFAINIEELDRKRGRFES